MARLVDPRVAGILALEVNRLLQPSAWQPLEEGAAGKEWRPVWAVVAGDEAGWEQEDGEGARGRSARGQDRSRPPYHSSSSRSRSRSRSESTARGLSSPSSAAATSLPVSSRVRVQCLAVVACLAAHYPKALASHWALLLPDGPAPTRQPRPRSTVSTGPPSSAPGPPPLLLLVEWAEEGRVRAQAAAALAAIVSTGAPHPPD